MELFYAFSFFVFLGYIILILIRFGVPESLSETAYLFGKNGHIIFYAVFISFILPLLIYWLDITKGQNNQFMVFVSCAALCFTGITGRFKEKGKGLSQHKIHLLSTLMTIILSQAWMWTTYKEVWKLSIVIISACVIVGYNVKGAYREPLIENGKETFKGCIKQKNTSVIFWVEMGLFLLIYSSIFIYNMV